MNIIPYGKQNITEEDINAVVAALKSDFLTQGPKIKDFEDAFASYIGCQYAVAVASGTAALHLCAIALDVQAGHKVITTPITFAASANCIRYCGADVVFADIDPETFLLDINEVRRLLRNSAKGSYKGIIPVDFAGKPVDMRAYRELADEYGLWLIEDACHAPGGYFLSEGDKHHCGDGTFADLAIFSFHPVKHIAAGEGGMITTNNFQLYKKLLLLRSHGITRYMEMQMLGYNYRLTDFQAALGLSQLQRAHVGLERRVAIARKYDQAFSDKPTIKRQLNELKDADSGHAYHLYVIEVDDRLGLYNHLREHNIFAQIHYIPCHLMPYYRALGWKQGDFPRAENYYKHCISLPMYPTLTDDEIEMVIKTVVDYVRE
jgi:UDP-4-amino-4,6-dideoxy-N-acetyl-beta-L-altrosamine transaminase